MGHANGGCGTVGPLAAPLPMVTVTYPLEQLALPLELLHTRMRSTVPTASVWLTATVSDVALLKTGAETALNQVLPPSDENWCQLFPVKPLPPMLMSWPVAAWVTLMAAAVTVRTLAAAPTVRVALLLVTVPALLLTLTV